MLEFIRSDLATFAAYTPHPSGSGDSSAEAIVLDHLDTNENPYDLPDELKQKLAWLYQNEIQSNRYPDGEHGALKQAIVEYVSETIGKHRPENPEPLTKDKGQGTTDETPPSTLYSPPSTAHISIGNGSDELIRSLLIATCLNGEGAVLVAEPTFSMYEIEAKGLGIPVVKVGRSPITFEMDLVAAEAAIATTQDPPIRAVFVVHPNSPTGNALTTAELDWLRNLPAHILVVVDEAYFEFSQQTVVGELAERPNWAVLRTFSKAFRLAAHRIGYAIAHPELIAALEKIRLPYNLPSSTQAAAQLALAHRRQLLTVILELLQERDRLFHALSACPELQVWRSDANFLFVRLQPAHAQLSLATIHQQLKAAGTLVRHTCNGLRITVGTPAENTRTIARLQHILQQIVLQQIEERG